MALRLFSSLVFWAFFNFRLNWALVSKRSGAVGSNCDGNENKQMTGKWLDAYAALVMVTFSRSAWWRVMAMAFVGRFAAGGGPDSRWWG